MSETIVVVDDEKPIREMLVQFLERTGYKVVAAESGERALEVVAQTPVDLAITDLQMSEMDGLSLAQKLLEQDPDRPVLLMTAFADMDSARRSVGLGIYEYFPKPLNLDDVVGAVRRGLEYRRLVLEVKDHQRDLEHKVQERTRQLKRKVQELEARDQLLRHLLLDQESGDSLSVALTLALNLCDCDWGALYMIDSEDHLQMRALAGFGEEVDQPLEDLRWLTDEIMTDLKQALKTREPTFNHSPEQNRQNLGIHSLLLVPIVKGERPICILEVGKKRRDVLVGETELEMLQGFFPYVAIAAADYKLQESIPEWEGNVDEVLKAAKEWSN